MSNNFDDLYEYLDAPRFDETRLAGQTVATLTSLINDSAVGLKIDSKAEKLWVALTGKEPLNSAEREVITNVIRSLQEGTTAMGLSYEEMGFSKGTKVVYAEECIKLCPRNGTEVTIPNFPVPPPPKVITRPCQEWVDPWVIANFDISSGMVSDVRQRRDLDLVWTGQYSRFTVAGLDGMKGIVAKIVATSPQWDAIRKDKKSCQGWPFFDLWTAACATCPFDFYLALHDVVITKILKLVVFSPTQATKNLPVNQQVTELRALKAPTPTGPVVAYPQTSLRPLRRDEVSSQEERDAVTRLIARTRHIPYLISGPLPTMINFYVESTADQIVATLAYEKLQKLFGGKKRGLGRIAASWNFGPRMGKVWREVNMLCMISDHVEGPKQIRVSSGAFPVMLARLKAQQDTSNKLLLSDTQSHLIHGLPVSDQQYVTLQRDIDTTFVGYEKKSLLPVFDPKTPATAQDKIALAYQTWESTLPKGSFAIYTKVFADKCFEDYNVHMLQSSFDLSAVVSTVDLLESSTYIELEEKPVNFFRTAVRQMRAMATWWHAPERTFPHLAGYYTPNVETFTWSQEDGFSMTPEFQFGDEGRDDYDDQDYGEEEWDEQEPEHEPVVVTATTTTTTTTTGSPIVFGAGTAPAVLVVPTQAPPKRERKPRPQKAPPVKEEKEEEDPFTSYGGVDWTG